MQSMESAPSIQRSSLAKYLIPLSLLGMTGSTISFLRFVCTGNSRWLILGILFLYFILKRNFLRYFDVTFGLVLFLYMGWCFFSSFWSTIPILSFMKSGILIILSMTMIRLGIEWVKINPWYKALNYVWMLTFFVLLSGFLGRYSASAYDKLAAATFTFQGLVNGANMFGELMVMSVPVLLWTLYCKWHNLKYRLFFSFLLLSCLHFLMLSLSRASMMAAAFIILGFGLSLEFKKKIKITIAALFLGLCFAGLNPSFIDEINDLGQKYIFKGNEAQSLFYSRERNWTTSYESAQEGGWVGLGYGMSYDQAEFNFDHGLTAAFFGREKGNSQLAIVEETGIIGLIFYVLLIFTILSKLVVLYFGRRDPDQRVMIGIIAGTFVGMIVQSGFEAWWDSPGSPENIYFWLLVGIIKGLEIISGRVYVESRIETQNRQGMAGLI